MVAGNPEDFVEGIVFTVSPSNIQDLRHYEGVEREVFVERKLEIEVERFRDAALEGRKPGEVAKILAAVPEQNLDPHDKSRASSGPETGSLVPRRR